MSKKRKCYYKVHNAINEHAIPFETEWALDDLVYFSDALRDVAFDYHYNHDGWEDSWPITFTLLDEDKETICSGTVDLMAVPDFEVSSLEVTK